jgi:peptide/nickel transport system ATP-binding protein
VDGSSEPLLEGRGVGVRFGHGDGAVDAVRDATVVVGPGEAVGIVGESGSGKTTLMRVLVGLQAPTTGEVRLEGRPILRAGGGGRFPPTERWKVQMVFQDPYSSLNPRQRVWQAVAEAVHVWQGLSGRAARDEALRLLGAMGISQTQASSLPKALSGGQRQRASVARALATRPRVLIADEPTSSIDQSAQAHLLNLLRRLQREQRLAILFVSHDLGVVRYLTSRVYVMQRGEIVESGPTAEVFERPRHDYTRLLIASIPGRPAGVAQSTELIR